jgi:hypothetical protein
MIHAVRRVPPQRGFVCFAAVDWWYHNRAHSDIQLMTNLARDRPVLLVNSITMRMPIPGRSPQAWRRIGRKAKSMAKLIRTPLPDVPGFHVMTPVILPAYGSALGRRINTWLVVTQVRMACRLLRFRTPDIIVTLPTALPAAERLPHRKLIFNRSDKHSAFPEVDAEYVGGLEAELLARADHVLYVSSALMAEDDALSSGRAHFLDHGVDIEHFRPAVAEEQAPADVGETTQPCIGFFGGFDDYIIDFDLLERVAVEIPEARLLLIGHATCSMDQLTRHPNVSWLGGRDYQQIPAYGRCFDVALMPWLQNDWIRYCNPIKLKEYLLLGLPVVSTYFPEVERFSKWVDVAHDADQFVALVRAALEGSARRAVDLDVSTWSWSDRAGDLMSLAEGDLLRAAG